MRREAAAVGRMGWSGSHSGCVSGVTLESVVASGYMFGLAAWKGLGP